MRPTLKTVIPALAVSLTLAACGSSSNSSSSTSPASTSPAASASAPASAAPAASSSSGADVVKSASNASLGATVLVDAQGMTLYHLSSEKNGKFVCTSAACVAAWPPVSASASSASITGLETVKRPDGTEQLAYKGEPLYTFAGDKAAGEANGQGVKADGGVWSAVSTGATTVKTTSSGEGAGGGYGY
jgi:predicted lipoprotein with Yx(FWY)xxD motif